MVKSDCILTCSRIMDKVRVIGMLLLSKAIIRFRYVAGRFFLFYEGSDFFDCPLKIFTGNFCFIFYFSPVIVYSVYRVT